MQASHLLNSHPDSKSHSVLALERIPLGCRAGSTVVAKLPFLKFENINFTVQNRKLLSLPRCTTFETKIKEKKSVIYFNTNYGKWHATIKRETAATRSTSISTFLCESVKKCFNDRRIDRDAARKRDQPRGREKLIEKYPK